MFKIFKKRNKERDDEDQKLNLSSGKRYINTNWMSCCEIEKIVNEEIIERLDREPNDALEDMKKDITRCEYVIEDQVCRAIDFDHLMALSKASEHTRWVHENAVALSFCHQGLCKLAMDNLGLKYNGFDISSIGLSAGDLVNGQMINAPLIRFTFSNEGGMHFITFKVDGRMSALSTNDDDYIADRETSKLYFGLRMQFILDNKRQPKIKIHSADGLNMYKFMFTESDD